MFFHFWVSLWHSGIYWLAGPEIIFIVSPIATIHQGCTTCGSLTAGLQENGERMRKWTENVEIEIHSLHFHIFSLFPPPPLSISYIKNCLILSQNVKYGPFVANVIKNLASLLNENEIIQALELFTPLVYMKRKRLLLFSLYFLKDHSWSLPWQLQSISERGGICKTTKIVETSHLWILFVPSWNRARPPIVSSVTTRRWVNTKRAGGGSTLGLWYTVHNLCNFGPRVQH